MIFQGLSSGTFYHKPVYNPDVAGTLIRIDNGSGTPTSATTGSDFCTFDEPTRLVDCAFVTGIVDTVNLRVMANNNPTVYWINWASSVNTLATRAALNITFKAGTRISFMSSV